MKKLGAGSLERDRDPEIDWEVWSGGDGKWPGRLRHHGPSTTVKQQVLRLGFDWGGHGRGQMTRKAEWDLEDEIGSRSSQRSVRLPNWLSPQLTTAQPWELPDKRAREVERNRRGFPCTAGTPKAGPSLVPNREKGTEIQTWEVSSSG